jgi:hypothetical protein
MTNRGDVQCRRKDCPDREKHSHCRLCGFTIAVGAGICGECACEDDCAPD